MITFGIPNSFSTTHPLRQNKLFDQCFIANHNVILYTLNMNIKQLENKKNHLDTFRPLNNVVLSNLADWFRIELTYNSNAIEGNTLTRQETALVIEKGLTVGGKALVEHLEATNHSHAIEWIRERAKSKKAYSKSDILSIHI